MDITVECPRCKNEIPNPRRSNRKTRLPEMSRGDGRAGATSETGDSLLETGGSVQSHRGTGPEQGHSSAAQTGPAALDPFIAHLRRHDSDARRASRRERTQVRGKEVCAQEVVNRPARGWWNRPARAHRRRRDHTRSTYARNNPNHRSLYLEPNHLRIGEDEGQRRNPRELCRVGCIYQGEIGERFRIRGVAKPNRYEQPRHRAGLH